MKASATQNPIEQEGTYPLPEAQKDRFLKNDVELFSLLGGHAASALVSARLYGRADRKVRTLQAMLHLLEEPEAEE